MFNPTLPPKVTCWGHTAAVVLHVPVHTYLHHRDSGVNLGGEGEVDLVLVAVTHTALEDWREERRGEGRGGEGRGGEERGGEKLPVSMPTPVCPTLPCRQLTRPSSPPPHQWVPGSCAS